MNSKAGIMLDRREMLRVKLKSLAEEARIIRREEHRTQRELQAELHWHRVISVRYEARTTHLAYGIVRGVAVERIERPLIPRNEILWKKVRGMVEKYGPVDPTARATLLEQCCN